uniref:Sema domain-containing protein n=1 Tax=Pyxicephalus adspersus TaxID=30357 RepID=A0AAV3AX23_PYXAD|nr:TPA: hypothetical protein GDO54_006970 [Pyxicephalus adspersus]
MPKSFSASTLLCFLIRFIATDLVLSKESFTFTHPIHNIATGRHHVVVATENRLYLFNHTLHNLAVRDPQLDDVKSVCSEKDLPPGFYNKILLVYNDIVLGCWNKNLGACRQYSVNNLTLLKGYGVEIVSCNPKHTAAGFIVQKANEINLVTAALTREKRIIAIRKYSGDVFGIPTEVNVKHQTPVLNFVDAFEWKGKYFFLYYPSIKPEGRLLVYNEDNIKFQLSSQYNLTCGTAPHRGVILSSFAFASSGSFFWAGIFSTTGIESPDRTALCIYNITLLDETGCIYTDFEVDNDDCVNNYKPLLINSKPLVVHRDLTAVFFLEVQKTWVLFLGTGNGQLLKVTLDSNYTARCPQIFHDFEKEAAVFRTMQLDPLNKSYLYVATVNEITLSIKKNPSLFDKQSSWSCEFQNNRTKEVLCSAVAGPLSLICSCPFPVTKSSDRDILTANAKSNNDIITEHFQFNNCLQYSQYSCLECISNGCLYCTKESACRSPLTNCTDTADEVNIMAALKVLITGENLQNLSRMFLVGAISCKPQQVQIKRDEYWNNTHAFISLPKAEKQMKQLCVHFDGRCHQGLNIVYELLPTCSVNFPNFVWLSGGRKLLLSGKGLNLVDKFSKTGSKFVHKDFECLKNDTHCYFIAERLSETNQIVNISLHIEENIVTCGSIHYKADPIFTSFIAIDAHDTIEVRIKKKKDDLHIRADEIQVFVNSNLTCEVRNITEWADEDIVFCKAKQDLSKKIDVNKIVVKVVLGSYTQELTKVTWISYYIYILLVIPVLLGVVIVTCVITRYKSKKLSEKLSKQMEQLECDIRQEIRDGFAEFQIDKEDVTVEAVGTIPFFDYKHFALNTFFPESDGNRQDFSEKLCENVPSPFQKNPKNLTDENDALTTLKILFENQGFLVLLIHTLEKQKDFSVKDRCMFASFLTIIFQNNLLSLTGLLETLIKDLIEQSNNKNPKLMLRRTETVVEKLLTNWMATCLYGFLRESVGEPLYGLVCTLNQRIHKGPMDVITCKALYTLNEDWLLWQITDFNNVDINVHFPAPEGEAVHDADYCIKVTVLDCDTIGQVKEKILQTFLSKNGYSFSNPLCDICLELHFGQTYKELSDVDDSSVVMDNGLRKLNTVKHYKIENGATIKIIIRKNHDPESEENDLQNMENKGKQKFKVKEMYLTKLLSTKVQPCILTSILFNPVYYNFLRFCIWTISHKPPVAVKYFFDFLDTQGEIKKISDPDVLHIWKTNSLPLRFWVNILKNPQFVFDIKKTALLDSCLSVIGQAFMDGFSLAEQQLGKSAPTNKLLYAKDIPQFKEEIRSYYKNIRDAPPLSSTELTEFLTSESKKHQHEFKDDVAIFELYKYIEKYNDVILSTLEKETGFESEVTHLLNLQKLSKDKKKWAWQ